MVDPREPDLLDCAPADRVREGRFAAVIAFGLIASAVCALSAVLRPVLNRTQARLAVWELLLVIQYSFIPVVAIAFLMIFEQFVFRFVTTLPRLYPSEYGVYALQRSPS